MRLAVIGYPLNNSAHSGLCNPGDGVKGIFNAKNARETEVAADVRRRSARNIRAPSTSSRRWLRGSICVLYVKQLLVAQRLDRVEVRRFEGRISAEHDSHDRTDD